MQVGVIGAGLIGTSLIDAIAQAGAADRVLVLDSSSTNLAIVLDRFPAAREAASSEEFAGCAFIFLCTPVNEIAGYVRALASFQAIVIDVGSVKESIRRDLEATGSLSPRHVPGHPLSGATTSGPAGASAEVVRARPFVITPYAATDSSAVESARAYLHRLGMRTLLVDAALHDRVLALTSHLPHLAAFAFAALLAEVPAADRGDIEELIPNSFRSVTRFAQSDAAMWADIFSSNSAEVRAAAARLTAAMDALMALPEDRLQKRLEELREVRNSIG